MTKIVAETKPAVPLCINPVTGELVEYQTFEERQKDLIREEMQKSKEKKQEKSSPFNQFYQVNKRAGGLWLKLIRENRSASLIFQFLINNMDGYNAVICSYKIFEEALGLSKPTVQRAISYLKQNKYIEVMKSGTSNVYIINPQIVWNSWGSNYKYCKFSANIILSESENLKIKDIEKRIEKKRPN